MNTKRLFFLVVPLLAGLIFTSTVIFANAAFAQINYPGWRQSNENGFGDINNTLVGGLESYNGMMYAGTWNNYGAQIWRTSDGQAWYQITPSWSLSNTGVNDLAVFGNELYAGTWNYNTNGGEIWRTDGTTWEPVVSGGFTDTNNEGVNTLFVFSGTLYAATTNLATGMEIWRSSTGNMGSWEKVHNFGADVPAQYDDVTMDVYEGYLYLGLSRSGLAELWRTDNGLLWTSVFTDGLGNVDNTHVSAMAEYQGDFYIGLRNPTTGGEVWRSNNGISWTPVFTGGLGNPNSSRPYGLIVYDNRLYLDFSNGTSGTEIWVTPNGLSWQRIVAGGWGNSHNIYGDYYDKSAAIFNNSIFFGATNNVNGCEIWQLLHQGYLPLLLK